MSPLTRRAALLGTLAASLAGPRAARADTPRLSIGYQKNGALLILKQQATLEAHGIAVSWHEFGSGPPLLEAMNAAAIDFGATGDTPPIFAQAAGADLVYVAYQPVPGRSEGVVVHDDGPIHTLPDLRGKRIAFTKGSSAQNVLLGVLRAAGLAYTDITPVYLQPAEAMAAFRQGAVDAWSIWDPFFAIAERLPGARLLTNAEHVAPSNSFFLAGRAFATANASLIRTVIDEVGRATAWIGTHQDELARTLSAATGVPEDIERVAAARGNYETGYVTEAVVAQQQQIADAFAALHLIPHPVRVRDAVWTPPA
jgi:aliphatic sulfonates family ABC transporter substrate-binding protein